VVKYNVHISIYGSTAINLGLFSSFFVFSTVGRSPWTGDQPVESPLPTDRTAQIQNKRVQISLPQVGFEPKILVFVLHALDHSATVIGI
jgi:hypothetical protein